VVGQALHVFGAGIGALPDVLREAVLVDDKVSLVLGHPLQEGNGVDLAAAGCFTGAYYH
jgi:hypothetical protein